jgi:hypothetical protein
MAQKRKRSERRNQAEGARSGEGRAYEADMRVLLFGAGASMRAGYPLASELISATEEFVHSEREVMRRTYWNRWESWRRNAEGIVVADLRGPNTAERSCRRGLNRDRRSRTMRRRQVQMPLP